MTIRSTVPAPLLVLGSVVSVQAGMACGKGLSSAAGPAGVVALRLAFTALALLLIWRPRPPRRESLGLIAALGAAIAGMQLIYPAMDRLPVGIASAFQFLGPLALALAKARRPADLLWAALAGTGVFLLSDPLGSPVPLAGAALALGSGACMAAYLVLNKRAGASAAGGAPLAWAVLVAALLVLPFAPTAGDAVPRPHVLVAGLGVALLSAVVPWSLDMAALRRLPERVVAVMVSLEPAAGAVAGLVLLGEHLAWPSWLAIACVSAASAGAAAAALRTAASPGGGGEGDGDPRPGSGRAVDVHAAAEGADTVGEAGQAAARDGGGAAGAVVADLGDDAVRARPDAELDGPGAGVLDGVGDRLAECEVQR
ncbi:EamA family transporter [Actinomadura rubrisoli]|uniref:EamA family transporter n=1 Tax=Actinomadura rubrisoli TaxID=2530368 RepID=A0A4R5C0I3_9ACTN|nr:EamA family transporter [Actinomadura rubrisoli]TDD93061.1 EamA family transporter [Actinomadura rubrisoli]